MTEGLERRAIARTGLAECPPARVRGLREVRLLDLSPAGAQIEHLDLFRLGASCALDLPPPCGALSLSAEVVWCAVVGRKRKLGGDSHLVARSGLRFTTLTTAQRAALAESLRHLATEVQPKSHRRTA
jgi:hypothetical protein